MNPAKGWQALGRCWALAPILGWVPGISLRVGMLWWWTLLSVLVIGVGWTQPIRRQVGPLFGWLILLTGWAWLTHLAHGPHADQWLFLTVVILTAAHTLAERGEWTWLRDGVIWGAWLQIPYLLAGPSEASVYVGSLGKRAALSVLLGVASLWSYGWRAVAFAGLACWTGGWVGAVPAVARLLRWGLAKFHAIGLMLTATVLAFSFPWWMPKVIVRLTTWAQAWHLRAFWLTGWGFVPTPYGFQDVKYGCEPACGTFNGWRDWHNTFLDVTVRFGVLGVLALAVFFWWAWRVSRHSWQGRWLFWSACWMGFWQSAEGMPVMILCWLAWTVWMQQEAADAHSI